ncbi:DUF3298 and DUF4163 domain-containing protein [Intestinibacillus massiliensis]|nr:DUF3298 and DUF4163 domain-containing protein [Intestinibacillus massiliensis]
MQHPPFQIRPMAMRGVLHDGGTPVLDWKIVYPCFTSRRYAAAAAQLSAFYRSRALAQRRQDYQALYPGAAAASRAGDAALPYQSLSVFTAPFAAGCLASVYTDVYQYTGGANGTTVRTAETWNLETGRPVPLSALFPARTDCEGYILGQIKAQVARQPDQFFPDAAALAAQYFDPRRFYLTPQGVTVYYSLYEIAPHSSGIPAFRIPYDAGPVRLLCGRCL